MRNAMMESLMNLAEKDSDLMLLTGDLGFGVFEEFEKRHPKQFLNVGVSEQNMIGIASGLALKGKKVFVYSIGNFPTLRCLEQIRNDACYHQLNINIVAMGAGFSYGALGMSHHATEDIAIMSSLPEVTVLSPSTKDEAKQLVNNAYFEKGVCYIRIDKSSITSDVPNPDIKIGNAYTLAEGGSGIIIFATGGIAEEAIKARSALLEEGVYVEVASISTVKPIDREFILSKSKQNNYVITLEEHNTFNGLGTLIANLLYEEGVFNKKFTKLGVDDEYVSIVGSQKFLREYCGIDAISIKSIIKKYISEL